MVSRCVESRSSSKVRGGNPGKLRVARARLGLANNSWLGRVVTLPSTFVARDRTRRNGSRDLRQSQVRAPEASSRHSGRRGIDRRRTAATVELVMPPFVARGGGEPPWKRCHTFLPSILTQARQSSCQVLQFRMPKEPLRFSQKGLQVYRQEKEGGSRGGEGLRGKGNEWSPR